MQYQGAGIFCWKRWSSSGLSWVARTSRWLPPPSTRIAAQVDQVLARPSHKCCLLKDLVWQHAESSPNQFCTSKLSLRFFIRGLALPETAFQKLKSLPSQRSWDVYVSLSPSLHPDRQIHMDTHIHTIYTYTSGYMGVCVGIYIHIKGGFVCCLFFRLLEACGFKYFHDGCQHHPLTGGEGQEGRMS